MLFKSNKPQVQVVTVAGEVVRCGFISFDVELSPNRFALLIKTNTGTQLMECCVPRNLLTKLALTAAGDQVKMVAQKEDEDQTLYVQEFYNTSLTGIG